MRISNEWFSVVLKCDSSEAKKTLTEFYRFIDSLKGVQSLHFLIRDRVEDEVVLCFRIMVKPGLKETTKGKAASKLGTLLQADKFAVDPDAGTNLAQYVAWSPEKRIRSFGPSKFVQFVDVLKSMSSIVIELIENNYFESSERVELAHIISWMLGCTEYGLVSTSGMEVGYYDRLLDKYCSHLRQNFPQANYKKEHLDSAEA